jgi:hypothetical protein
LVGSAARSDNRDVVAAADDAICEHIGIDARVRLIVSVETMLGRNRRTSKRPSGYNACRRSIVAVVIKWTTTKIEERPRGQLPDATALDLSGTQLRRICVHGGPLRPVLFPRAQRRAETTQSQAYDPLSRRIASRQQGSRNRRHGTTAAGDQRGGGARSACSLVFSA